jgi:hypothetical protein
MLRTSLQRLALIMSMLALDLCLAVTKNRASNILESSANTISNTGAVVLELSLGLLSLALGVLLRAVTLQLLW